MEDVETDGHFTPCSAGSLTGKWERALPTVTLTEIFRQASTSQIIVNAHRINQGQLPTMRDVGSSVTGCVKMHENRRFENEVSKKRDEASPASIMIDANDTQARAVYDSIWPLMRKLLPSMTTISAWCNSRSRMAEVKVLSLLNILGHSLNARFEVSMIEPCS